MEKWCMILHSDINMHSNSEESCDISAVSFLIDMCDPGWHCFHDVLIVLGFAFSILPIILIATVPFIYTPLRGQVLVCCKKCEKVFRLNILSLTQLP